MIRAGIATVLVAVAVWASPAFAEDIQHPSPLFVFKELDASYTQTVDQYKESSQPYEGKTGDFSYVIRLPQGWKNAAAAGVQASADTADPAAKRLPGLIAEFNGPVALEGRSTARIRTVAAPSLMRVLDWVVMDARARGLVLRGLREMPDGSVRAEYLEHRVDQARLTRFAIRRVGAQMVIVEAVVPESLLEGDRNTQIWAVDSAVITPLADDVAAEEMSSYAFLDLIGFDFPASWTLDAKTIIDPSVMDASIASQALNLDSESYTFGDTQISGRIDIRVLTRDKETPVSLELERIRGEVAKAGMEIGAKILSARFKTDPSMTFQRTEALALTDPARKVAPSELWISILANDRFMVVVTMRTQSPDAQLSSWARNVAAYEKVIETIRPF